jgi:hypothetical protein
MLQRSGIAMTVHAVTVISAQLIAANAMLAT